MPQASFVIGELLGECLAYRLCCLELADAAFFTHGDDHEQYDADGQCEVEDGKDSTPSVEEVSEDGEAFLLGVCDGGEADFGHGVAKEVAEGTGHAVSHADCALRHEADERDTDE